MGRSHQSWAASIQFRPEELGSCLVPLGSGPAGNLPKSQTLNRKGLPRVLGSGLVPLGSRRRVDAGYVSLLGLLFAPSRSARRNTIRSADVGGCRISSQSARRNKNKPKRANLVFCTTDKTNNPPTDQSVDYSVLSPRTNKAPAIAHESRGGAKRLRRPDSQLPLRRARR